MPNMAGIAFTPANWFWCVGGDTSRYWSSSAASYVATIPAGAGLTQIDTEANLSAVLSSYGLKSPLGNPVIPGLVFLGRFTSAEYAAIIQKAATDMTLSMWLDMLRVNGEINVTDTAAQSAKSYLVTNGLLTQARADTCFAPQ